MNDGVIHITVILKNKPKQFKQIKIMAKCSFLSLQIAWILTFNYTFNWSDFHSKITLARSTVWSYQWQIFLKSQGKLAKLAILWPLYTRKYSMFNPALFDDFFILFFSGTFDIFVKIDGNDKNVSTNASWWSIKLYNV